MVRGDRLLSLTGTGAPTRVERGVPESGRASRYADGGDVGHPPRRPSERLMRRLWIGAGVGVVLIVLGGASVAWRAHAERQCRGLLDEARREMERGRYGAARLTLLGLRDRRPGWGD